MTAETTRCDRCGDATISTIMSKFNRDLLCQPCKRDERFAPGYRVADQAECAAALSGWRDYPGVGLGPFDLEFLTAWRAVRRTVEGQPGRDAEYFNWLDLQWDIDRAWRLVLARETRDRPVIFHLGALPFGLVYIDTARALTGPLDHTLPLLLTRPYPDDAGRLLIDGWHRAYRAKQAGKTHLLALTLTDEEEAQCRVSARVAMSKPWSRPRR